MNRNRTLTNNEQNKTYSDSSNGGHAVYVSKNKVMLTNPTITKTGDSYMKSLDCDEDAVKLNSHKRYVNGKLYEYGTSSEASISDVNNNQNNNVQSGQTSTDMPNTEEREKKTSF